jgi:hypothetical protein
MTRTMLVSRQAPRDRRLGQEAIAPSSPPLGSGVAFLPSLMPPAAIGASLEKDAGALPTFFDFPAEHRKHLRTSNEIESLFATLRLHQRVVTRFRFKQPMPLCGLEVPY